MPRTKPRPPPVGRGFGTSGGEHAASSPRPRTQARQRPAAQDQGLGQDQAPLDRARHPLRHSVRTLPRAHRPCRTQGPPEGAHRRAHRQPGTGPRARLDTRADQRAVEHPARVHHLLGTVRGQGHQPDPPSGQTSPAVTHRDGHRGPETKADDELVTNQQVRGSDFPMPGVGRLRNRAEIPLREPQAIASRHAALTEHRA